MEESPTRRSSSAKLAPGSSREPNMGVVIGGRRLPVGHLSAEGPPSSYERLLAALLDVGLHELLGVGLEDLVDLVEQVVELRLELVAPLGGGRRLLDHL